MFASSRSAPDVPAPPQSRLSPASGDTVTPSGIPHFLAVEASAGNDRVVLRNILGPAFGRPDGATYRASAGGGRAVVVADVEVAPAAVVPRAFMAAFRAECGSSRGG